MLSFGGTGQRARKARWVITRREFGEVHPGIRWGPFTLRIPFYHFGIEWPETIQGLIVAGATGLALIPILTGYFGLSYDVSLAIVIIQSFLIASAPLIWGDPYCHGWVTPAIPLVLAFIGTMKTRGADTTEIIQTITAFTLLNAAIFLLFGLSGLGRLIVAKVPIAIKSGIIFGAAVSAFAHEFRVVRAEPQAAEWMKQLEEHGLASVVETGFTPPRSYLLMMPSAAIVAVAICMVLMFSRPLEKFKHRYRWVALLASLGLAPGFLVGMAVAYFTNEATWSDNPVDWLAISSPPWREMWDSLSPFAIGFPTPQMFLDVASLCLVVYIIAFGDIVTANEMIRVAEAHRPDEKLDLNATRTHYNMAIRNAVQGLVCGPYPVTHGPLWTGVMVVVTERYKQGRKAMDTLFGGISAYYFWGFPILLFWTPMTDFLKPLLPVALSMTMLLTGFACSYIAMAIPRTNVERGVALAIGMILAFFGATEAIVLGVIMTLVMSGWTTDEAPVEMEADVSPPQPPAED